jgi:hypothetical protein
MGPADIARATESKVNTTNDRLARLREKGLVERGESGWRCLSTPTSQMAGRSR